MKEELLIRTVALVILLVAFQAFVARVHLGREAKRRIQHSVTGHAIVQISYILPYNYCIGALTVGVAGIFWLRMFHERLYLRVFGPLLRPNERKQQLPGAFYFLFGTLLTALLFPLPIARYAVECLALADPMAAYIGRTRPILKITPSLSLSGSVACFVTAYLVGYFSLQEATAKSLLRGAIACTVAEAFPYGNDNFLIPLVTAATVYFYTR